MALALAEPFIQGALESFSLYEVLQLLAAAEDFLGVDVFAPGMIWAGRIWLKGDQVLGAVAEEVPPGVEAFYHLLSFSHGRFIGGRAWTADPDLGTSALGDVYGLLIDVAHDSARRAGESAPLVSRRGSFLVFEPSQAAS